MPYFVRPTKTGIKGKATRLSEERQRTNLHHVLEDVAVGVGLRIPLGFADQKVTLEEEDVSLVTFPGHSGSRCSFPDDELSLKRKKRQYLIRNGGLWQLLRGLQTLRSI